MQTPEDEAAQRKRVNASLAKIRRAERAEQRERYEQQRQLAIGGVPAAWNPDAESPGPYKRDDLDIPLWWFAVGFAVLCVFMAWMMALA